jgi:outer membrane lipoprotein-sorting protein
MAMKTRFLLLISLSVFLFQCGTDEETKSPVWGVDFSTESAINFAEGSIDQQNAGPKVTYILNAASLRQKEDKFYTVSFTFENGEILQLEITKKTEDFNYHFPGNDSENQLISATFNGSVLELSESAMSIQPRLEENKLEVVANMHTLNAGDFNGTLSRVPLIK